MVPLCTLRKHCMKSLSIDSPLCLQERGQWEGYVNPVLGIHWGKEDILQDPLNHSYMLPGIEYTWGKGNLYGARWGHWTNVWTSLDTLALSKSLCRKLSRSHTIGSLQKSIVYWGMGKWAGCLQENCNQNHEAVLPPCLQAQSNHPTWSIRLFLTSFPLKVQNCSSRIMQNTRWMPFFDDFSASVFFCTVHFYIPQLMLQAVRL